MGSTRAGLIPPGLPSFTLPDLRLVEQLVPGALCVALMSFTESIAAGRAFAGPDERLGRDRMLVNTPAAIERYQALQAAAGELIQGEKNS